MTEVVDIDAMIDGVIDREGGFVNHPADKGGSTCFGITEAVARAHGYAGEMRRLPRAEAAAIYRRLYWLRPRMDEVARRSARLAAELFDTGQVHRAAVLVDPALQHRSRSRLLSVNGTDHDLVRRR